MLLTGDALKETFPLARNDLKAIAETIMQQDKVISNISTELRGYQMAFAHFGLNLQGEETISIEEYIEEVDRVRLKSSEDLLKEMDDAMEHVRLEHVHEAWKMLTAKVEELPKKPDALPDALGWLQRKIASYKTLVDDGGTEEQVASWQGYLDGFSEALSLSKRVAV
jgi:hypothetical protein